MLTALVLVCVVAGTQATRLFDRNLAYRSPFAEHPQASLAHRTDLIAKRAFAHVRRQVTNASDFSDDHYPTFYGGDFSNSPFIWNGGLNFTHSVASVITLPLYSFASSDPQTLQGDPFDTSVLLWTRAEAISPAGSNALPDQSVPVCVSYKISTSSDLSGEVDSGSAFTSYDVDWTLKVEATGLKPDTKYFYGFADCTNPTTTSPIGTTRTLASPNTPAQEVNGGKPLSIAVFSCSQFQAGWFNAYGYAAHNTTADIFIHLGDYIYESLGGASIGRQVLGRIQALFLPINPGHGSLSGEQTPGHVILTLIELIYLRRDDHEADQAWKAGTADSNDTAVGCAFSSSGACFTDRKLASVRAYHEWMPIREVVPDDKLRIWRNFQIGKLLDLTMLDTRQYDRDITDLYYNTEFINSIADFKNRSLMGAAQEQCVSIHSARQGLSDTLSESKKREAVWRVVGQQIVFTQLSFNGTFDVDAWDGYRANRARILDHLYQNEISNTVILSGDSHANWVSDLARAYDPVTGEGAIGVEFAGTAVTNISPTDADLISSFLVETNTELQWSEGFFRGFFLLSIDSETLNATFYGMENITFANLDAFPTAQFVVKNGQNRLSRPVADDNVKAGALKSSVMKA
ncbi:Alkaline phosphatase D [Termitomyces sp. J132]|nr:Alkaline phosphatase D [Termitomyces sp. J132]